MLTVPLQKGIIALNSKQFTKEGKMLYKTGMILLVLGISVVFIPAVAAQAVVHDDIGQTYFDVQPRMMIDAPTAWTLPRGAFDFVTRVYPEGGVLGEVAIGLSNHFMIGISYGADRIISEREAIRNPRLELNVKLKLVDEQYYFPAIAVGFASQGYGSWDNELDRYTYKSKGFYAVITRSLYFYKWSLGGHAGINYSLRNDDNDDDPSFFVGIDSRFSQNFALVMEYDLALNDNKSAQRYGRGRGYLNMGLKWIYSENLELEAILKNLLNNRRGVGSFSRGIRITYMEYL